MEENIKKPNGADKIMKATGIIAGVIILLVIIFFAINFSKNLLGVSGKNSYSQSIGTPDKSLVSSMSSPAAPMMSEPKETRGYQESAAMDSAKVRTAPVQIDKKIIKNGQLNLRVDSVDKAAEKITQIAKDNEGDVFSSSFSQYKANAKSGYITLKVPFKNFEKAFGEIKKSAIVVITESTSGQDVTEQYTDLQAQLKNKQAEEQSYIKLLDRAQKMEDILSITSQLSSVRGEIEVLQGRIRLMDAQTDMATINVNLSEDVSVTIVDSWRPWQVVKESTRELVKSVQGWIDFIIRLIIKVIPVLLLYGLILYIFYRIGKALYSRYRKKDTQV